MNRLAARYMVSLLMAISAFAALAPAAEAQPSCGDLITTPTILSADLHCTGGTALNVSADLDLNGHTIYGSDEVGDGIFGSDGTFTISDGTATGFRTGVNLGRGSRATVSRVTASDNWYGFKVQHIEAVLFSRDVAKLNLFDGFNATGQVAGPVTFYGDRADRNGRLGIWAGPGGDAGKNHAHKNGDPRQCVGVVCRP